MRFLYIIVITCLNFFFFRHTNFSQNIGIEKYEFISPKAESFFHNPNTCVIIRYGKKIDFQSVLSTNFQIQGDISGKHEGKCILLADKRTIIFEPFQPFTLGEKVRVNIIKSIKTISGDSLPDIQYSFSIRDSILKVDKSLNDSALFIAEVTAKKSSHSLKSVFGCFDLFTDPLVKILYANKPSSGNIFTTLAISGKYMLYMHNNEGIPAFVRIMPSRVINFKPHPWGICSYYDYELKAYITLDKELNYQETYRMGNGYETNMHEFVLLENGHSFLIAYDRVSMDMSTIVPGGEPDATVIGAVIQELDKD